MTAQTALFGIPRATPSAPVCGRLLNERGPSVDERSPRKPAPAITCSGCDATWTANSAAHCAADECHRTFSGTTLFDRHRSVFGDRGTCIDPADLRAKDGQPLCEFRDGMWRFPEMDEAAKAARFGPTASEVHR